MSDHLEKNFEYFRELLIAVTQDARAHGIFVVSIIENDNPISGTVGMEVISIGNPIQKFGLLCAAVEQSKRML